VPDSGSGVNIYGIQVFRPTSLQAYKPSGLQAFRPTSLQAYKIELPKLVIAEYWAQSGQNKLGPNAGIDGLPFE
jgi:hypothetical protein